jgi:hypothetical protein
MTAIAALFFCFMGAKTGRADETDVTDELIAPGKNGASIFFSIDEGYNDFLTAMGLEWAPGLSTGETSFVEDREGQLPGDSGFKISIPLDEPDLTGVVGVETNITLTPAMVGQKTFDEIVSFIADKHKAGAPLQPGGEGGFMTEGEEEFYIFYSAKDLFEAYGVSIMGLFQDGKERSISKSFQCGVLYDTDAFEDGKIHVTFGPLLADSDLGDGGECEMDLTDTLSFPTRMAILYDGNNDNRLEFSYWLAGEKREYDGNGGGCAAGVFGLAGLAILALSAGLRATTKGGKHA